MMGLYYHYHCQLASGVAPSRTQLRMSCATTYNYIRSIHNRLLVPLSSDVADVRKFHSLATTHTTTGVFTTIIKLIPDLSIGESWHRTISRAGYRIRDSNNKRAPAGPRNACPLSYFKPSSLDAHALKGGRGLLSFHITSTFLSATARLGWYQHTKGLMEYWDFGGFFHSEICPTTGITGSYDSYTSQTLVPGHRAS